MIHNVNRVPHPTGECQLRRQWIMVALFREVCLRLLLPGGSVEINGIPAHNVTHSVAQVGYLRSPTGISFLKLRPNVVPPVAG